MQIELLSLIRTEIFVSLMLYYRYIFFFSVYIILYNNFVISQFLFYNNLQLLKRSANVTR